MDVEVFVQLGDFLFSNKPSIPVLKSFVAGSYKNSQVPRYENSDTWNNEKVSKVERIFKEKKESH